MSTTQQRSDADVEKLVNENMPLVYYMTMKYQQQQEYVDTFSAGMDGLLRAAREYKGPPVPFGTYAGMRIKWKILRVFLAATAKKRGGSAYKVGYKAFDISIDEPSQSRHGELNSTLKEKLADNTTLTPAEELLTRDNGMTARSLVSQLDDRSRQIIELRFGLRNHEEHTLDAIGAILNLTRERVRQLQDAALFKMRQNHGYEKILGEQAPQMPVRLRDREAQISTARRLAKRGQNGMCRCGKKWPHSGRCFLRPESINLKKIRDSKRAQAMEKLMRRAA